MFTFKIRRRRRVDRLGPLRINRSGMTRVTSVTMHVPFWRTLVLWERTR